MNEKTLIDTKEANFLDAIARSSGSVFVQVLVELAQHPSNKYLPDLHLNYGRAVPVPRGDVQLDPLTKSHLK